MPDGLSYALGRPAKLSGAGQLQPALLRDVDMRHAVCNGGAGTAILMLQWCHMGLAR